MFTLKAKLSKDNAERYVVEYFKQFEGSQPKIYRTTAWKPINQPVQIDVAFHLDGALYVMTVWLQDGELYGEY